MSDLTVVVPAHGDSSLPARLVRELDAQAADVGRIRVVVCDDASPVPLAPALEALGLAHLDLTVVRAPSNRGPGAARNLAMRSVTTAWVAFLDADMIPGPGWLDRATRAADEWANIDAVEGRVDIPQSGPATPFTHATEFTEAGVHHGAGNVVYRTDVLAAVGGFDERYFDPRRKLHFREDTDLYFRLEKQGATTTYDPELVALHPPLPASYAAPIRLARRYYFDALLAREHSDAFRAMNATRRVGPMSLRHARHLAATTHAAGVLVAIAGALAGRRWMTAAGVAGAGAGWAATAVALSWRRSLRAAHAFPLAAVAAIVPWTYLWNYWRGVARFRHRPRL